LLWPNNLTEYPGYLRLVQNNALLLIWFAVIAAMVGMLTWPVTRRVLAATAGAWWGVLARLIYAGAIGCACGLFIAYHMPILSPEHVPWRPPTHHLNAIVPPIATALVWAVWYMLVEYAARSGPQNPA
jgi:hypothetical protein